MRLPRLLCLTVLGSLVVVGTAIVGMATPAVAQQDVHLEVVIGYDGSGISGTWTPVTVNFRPDRPVSGEVIVAVDTMEGTWNYIRPVEIAAGAPATVRMVVPPGRLRASLVSEGEVVGSHQQEGGFQPAEMLIGVVGGDVAAAPSINILPAETSARWVEIDREWLGIARGVASLDALVLAAGIWPEMDDQTRRQVWTEVTVGGMTLVLTDPDDGPTLPQPQDLADPSPRAHLLTDEDGQPQALVGSAGLGRVALVPGGHQQLEDPEVWAAVVGPRGVLDPINDWEAYERQPWAAQEMLAFEGGPPEAPGIPYLGAFLVLYVVAVGPVNAVLLRRWGKPEWAWVSVPVVSLLFAAAPLLITRPESSQVPLTVRTSTTWLEEGAQQRVGVAWPVTDTGDVRARLDGDGWVGVPWGFQAAGPRVTSGTEAVAVDAQLRNGEIAGLVASRTVPADSPPLTVTATVDGDGQIVVELRNDGDVPVRDINLMVGNSLQRIGDLDPGEGGSHKVEGRMTAGRVAPMFVAEQMNDPEFMGQGFSGGPGTVSGLLPAAVRYGTPGLVWATGVTDPDDLAITVDGVAVTQRGMGIVAVGAPVAAEVPATRAPPAAVLGQLVTPSVGPDPRMAGEAPGDAVMRFRLPPIAAEAQLTGSLFAMGGPAVVQLWDHTARTWRDVERDFAGVAAAPILSRSGEAYARVGGLVDGAGLGLALPGDPPLPAPLPAPEPFGMEFEVIEGPDGTFTEMPVPMPGPMMTPAPVVTLSPVPAPPRTATPPPTPMPPPTPLPTPTLPTPTLPTPTSAGPDNETTGR